MITIRTVVVIVNLNKVIPLVTAAVAITTVVRYKDEEESKKEKLLTSRAEVRLRDRRMRNCYLVPSLVYLHCLVALQTAFPEAGGTALQWKLDFTAAASFIGLEMVLAYFNYSAVQQTRGLHILA